MLTKTDIKALKTCDRLVFRCQEGKNSIEAIKEIKGNPWENEKRYIINIDQDTKNIKSAFAHIYTDSQIWQTIIEFLKPNDILFFEWGIDSLTNDYMRKSNLHGDVLFLKINRELKNGKIKRFKFYIDSYTCPDNSARMIKPEYKHSLAI